MIKNKKRAIPNFIILLVLAGGIKLDKRKIYPPRQQRIYRQCTNQTTSDSCQYTSTGIYQENLL